MHINSLLFVCLSLIEDYRRDIKSCIREIHKSPQCQKLPFYTKPRVWSKKELIGQGGYGSIFSIVPTDEICGMRKGTEVALKEMCLNQRNLKVFKNEVENLAFFKGNNHFLQIYGWGTHKQTGYMITELGKEDMWEYFKKHEISLKRKIEIIRNVVKAVISLHENNYVHLDLKWENVFCFDDNADIVKIGDFGLSQNNEKVTCSVGTLFMMAPEVCALKKSGSSNGPNWCQGMPADIYSLGMMINQILGEHYNSKTIHVDHEEMFRSLIADDPFRRPTAEKVLKILNKFERRSFEEAKPKETLMDIFAQYEDTDSE